jgi:hypothetical protein
VLLPHPVAQQRADVDRRHLEARVARRPAHPRHRRGWQREGEIEIGGQRAGRLLGADLALVGVDDVGVDALEGGEGVADAEAGGGDGLDHVAGQRSSQAAAVVIAEHRGEVVARRRQPAHEGVVGHDATHGAGQRREPPRAHGEARGVGDDVLELVGLVEHDHIVVR